MAGTTSGYEKVRIKMIEKLGSEANYLNWKRESGRKGGSKTGVKKGFAANIELARIAGQLGGTISRRKSKKENN